jgi:hypothetical protein
MNTNVIKPFDNQTKQSASCHPGGLSALLPMPSTMSSTLGSTIPMKLNNSSNRFQHNINIEEVCNGIIHPITTETITKYTQLMNGLALKGLWVPAMSKQLHCLAQEKEGSRFAPIQFSI